MERPRVCFVGAGRFTDPLDATQAKKFEVLDRDADVHVIGFASNARGHEFRQRAHFHLMPLPRNRLLRYLVFLGLGTWRTLRVAVLHGVDVVVAQSPYEAVPGAVAKRLLALGGRRLRCVVESHGDFEVALLDYRRVRLVGLYRRVMRAVSRATLGSADAIRAVSTSTAAQLARVAGRAEVHVFHTWTDLDVFVGAAGVDKQPGLFVYAGTLVPAKGVHVLIEAFAKAAAQNPQARLAIVGRPENPTYAAELRAAVERHGLAERIEFCAPLPQHALAALVARAQALVLASVSSEGLPRVILEAMSAGTAVVATSIAGAVEVLRHEENGLLVPPGDSVWLSACLNEILDDPDWAAEMGRRGRADVAGSFGTEVYRQGYARLIQSALTNDMTAPLGPPPVTGAT